MPANTQHITDAVVRIEFNKCNKIILKQSIRSRRKSYKGISLFFFFFFFYSIDAHMTKWTWTSHRIVKFHRRHFPYSRSSNRFRVAVSNSIQMNNDRKWNIFSIYSIELISDYSFFSFFSIDAICFASIRLLSHRKNNNNNKSKKNSVQTSNALFNGNIVAATRIN